MRTDEERKSRDLLDIWQRAGDYEGFRKLERKDVATSNIWLTQDGDLSVVAWLTDNHGGVLYRFSSDHLVSDFKAVETLKDLSVCYHSSRKSLWRLLEKLELDPWARVTRDYQSPMSLERVAKLHGMKPKTLSDGLKERGVPIRSGRIPVQLDPAEVQKALVGDPSTNELSRRLGHSWATAQRQRKQTKIDSGEA